MTLSMDELIKHHPVIPNTRTHELKAIREQAERMSELQADPRFEFYGRFLEVEIAKSVKLKERVETILLTKVLTPADYVEAKVNQARVKAYGEALQFAMTLAKTIIERGEQAVAEINLLEKEE